MFSSSSDKDAGVISISGEEAIRIGGSIFLKPGSGMSESGSLLMDGTGENRLVIGSDAVILSFHVVLILMLVTLCSVVSKD